MFSHLISGSCMLCSFCLFITSIDLSCVTFRMISRNNRTDYKLFFGTRGAFRSLGWNWLVLIVYLNGVVLCIPLLAPELFLPLLGILVAIGQFVCPGAPSLLARFPLQLRHAISLWSPVVAIIILLGPSLKQYSLSKQQALPESSNLPRARSSRQRRVDAR